MVGYTGKKIIHGKYSLSFQIWIFRNCHLVRDDDNLIKIIELKNNTSGNNYFIALMAYNITVPVILLSVL